MADVCQRYQYHRAERLSRDRAPEHPRRLSTAQPVLHRHGDRNIACSANLECGAWVFLSAEQSHYVHGFSKRQRRGIRVGSACRAVQADHASLLGRIELYVQTALRAESQADVQLCAEWFQARHQSQRCGLARKWIPDCGRELRPRGATAMLQSEYVWSSTKQRGFRRNPDFRSCSPAVDRANKGLLRVSTQVRGRPAVLLRQLSRLLESEFERNTTHLQRVRWAILVKHAPKCFGEIRFVKPDDESRGVRREQTNFRSRLVGALSQRERVPIAYA